MKRDPTECPGHWIPKAKIEGFIVNKIRNYVLAENNLLELVRITGEELGSEVSKTRELVDSIADQIRDAIIKLQTVNLPYLGNGVDDLGTDTTLQNYMNFIVQLFRGDCRVLLHVFADQFIIDHFVQDGGGILGKLVGGQALLAGQGKLP
jgi:hypothetical protein